MVSPAQVYVVVPAYNEGPVIGRVVADVRRAGHTAVVVDDGSSDATAQAACVAGAIVIKHPFNLGQGAALQTGIDYALAQRAGVPNQGTIRDIEQGKDVKLSNLQAVASALGLELELVAATN